MAATIKGGWKKPKVGPPNEAVHQHKPVPIVLFFAWLILNCRAHTELSICTASNSQLEVTERTRSDISRRKKFFKKKQEAGKEHSDVLLLSFRAVNLKLQMGPFRWRHAQQTGCSCFSQVKAEGFLANVHESRERVTHCRRHKACLSPPELLLPPPVSSSRFCQRGPAEIRNSWNTQH